jgi:2-amino-4-hydroxy-6-hydroxymethyldihydropteridine diphosphokinase
LQPKHSEGLEKYFMNGIYLLLGSNLGDRLNELSKAGQLLQENDIVINQCSSIYETEPWGIVDQPHFLNVVLKVETKRSPEQLLQICLLIENKMGRKREIKWGARNIDIDILIFFNEVISTDELTLPHPGVIDRRFTLLLLCELAGHKLHPEEDQTLQQLLDKLPDDQSCKRTELHLTL